MAEDKRSFSPSAARNRDPIFQCLIDRLPQSGTILEIASGTGEHAAHFSPLLPHLNWQPSVYEQAHRHSVDAWQITSGADNFLDCLLLDATSNAWPIEQGDYSHAPITGLFNANMIHISPWNVCEGLMAGAGRVLENGGILFLYGPFKIDGAHTSDSNMLFEKWLTDQNNEFGVRDLEQVMEVAVKNGLDHVESCEMPSNNFMQIFKKTT